MNELPITTYEPEMWTVRKDAIYCARDALKAGLEYAEYVLTEHKRSIETPTKRDKVWAAQINLDIELMKNALHALKKPYHE